MIRVIARLSESNFRVKGGFPRFNKGVNLEPYRSLMVELAVASGDFIRPFFASGGLSVDYKADHSPVTEADRGAEALMRRMIEARFPGHGIIGEEFGNKDPGSEFTWVLDPIDGTKSFTAAVPLFGTLIGLLHDGEPLLGCIHQPILGQLMVGDGETTTLNGRAVRTRATEDMAKATVLTSDPVMLDHSPAGRAFGRLQSKARLARTWGDCYGYLLVASGWADVMFDPVMNLWDIAALVPVVRGAGGVVTNAGGGAPYPADSTLACANARLHAQVLEALAG